MRSPLHPYQTRLLGLLLALAALPIPLASAARGADSPAQPATAQLDRLLGKLARPTPAQTPFVELRGSALLKQPQRLQGRLQQPDADTLVREVLVPFRERTTIRAERVLIERYGKQGGKPRTRTFSLRRAPELGSLLSSFTALLRGDRALLEKNYAVQMDGAANLGNAVVGDNRWRLLLTPLDPALQKRIDRIVLRGRGNALECMQLDQPNGQRTLTLLGMTAVAAAKVSDASALNALCDGKPAATAP